MTQDAKYFNAFNLIEGIGPIGFKKLLAGFASLKQAWSADYNQLSRTGLEKGQIENIINQRPKINPDREIEKVNKAKVELIIIKDENYPRLLKEIYNPPALLYIRGQLKPEDEISLAVVGTRKLSHYGKQITPIITADLARAGLTIVSGLAKGIDALAHRAALSANGRTIAVLGSAVDKKSVYPFVNQGLSEKIIQNGALISEYPVGTQARPQYFPQRNRIISGLSRGTLVIEAPEKSGALITAQNALEQNREVFAIPGPVLAPNSFGANNLIKMGAKLVNQANDVLEELNLATLVDSSIKRKIKPDSPEEALIIKTLSDQPVHIDKIIKKTKLTTAAVSSTLILMETKGKIKNLGGNSYVVAR